MFLATFEQTKFTVDWKKDVGLWRSIVGIERAMLHEWCAKRAGVFQIGMRTKQGLYVVIQTGKLNRLDC